jgi:hypothetical protein
MPAFFFIRAVFRLRRCQRPQPALLSQLVAVFDAVRGFFVEQHRFARRSAPLRQVFYDDFVFVKAAPDLQNITDLYRPGRFYPGFIDMYFTAVDGIRRQRTRFEKTRRPQPFIQAYFF